MVDRTTAGTLAPSPNEFGATAPGVVPSIGPAGENPEHVRDHP
jgi:hypothetical protein